MCVLMMSSVGTGIRQTYDQMKALLRRPEVQLGIRAAAYVLAGFGLSAASLANGLLPLAAGLVCACNGWSVLLVALGAAGGYLLFWGAVGYQGVAWTFGALACATLLRESRMDRQTPVLRPAAAALVVSATGLLFQLWLQTDTPVGFYVLQVLLGGGSTWLFARALEGRNPITDWLTSAVGILALAQIAPLPWLSLGFPAAGILAVAGAFPSAALAGLMLDLSGVCRVSMTAALCCSYLVRFIPRYPKWLSSCAPMVCCMFVMSLTGTFSFVPLPGLLLGGILGNWLPLTPKIPARRGETGVAQVRLEMAAGALLQTLQLLLEVRQAPVDEDALLEKAAQQACLGCPCRKSCKDSNRLGQLPAALLHKPLLSTEELPIICRKSGRFLAQLHRAQEQLRTIHADRDRQQEYREAVIQQYRFLAQYLQSLSDQLARRPENAVLFYKPRLQIFGNRPEGENGDRVLSFAGVGNRYYVILCDGMGTGLGAVQEGKTAGSLLRRMLVAGYPVEHALQSLNSICALRSRAGAVTVDLLELQLDTGRAALYKWGAVPSYLICRQGAEKIGISGPPPGISVSDRRDTVYPLSLRRGEILVMVSDGVGEEDALHCCLSMAGTSAAQLAESLLACDRFAQEDDATVVLVELNPGYAAPESGKV